MFRLGSSLLQKFRKSESGTTAIIFGIAVIPVMLCTGLAVDGARIFHVDRKLTAAIDAAALAAAKTLRDGGSDARVNEVASTYFADNMLGAASAYVHVRSVSVGINRATNAVTIDVDSQVKTVIFQIAGSQFATVDIPKRSVAQFDNKDIEIGLQLDVTGSMGQPSGSGGSKMDALKEAFSELVDIMLPAGGTTNTVRIGLAPFSSGVNAGPYAAAVSDNRARADGCVYERRSTADQATDLAPTGSRSLRARNELAGAEPCPDAEVMALTSDRSRLKRTVNGWNPSGWTAGHLGAAWAWALVSPSWASIWPSASEPAPYNDGKTQKFVILMTDGEYNTVGGRPGNEARSKRFAQDTCEAIRAKGVTVYTIGFRVDAAQKRDLTSCAGDASKFFDARDGDALKAALRTIAEEINNLRLSS